MLRGHRSIVNQVRYNPVYSVIASSGVEKMVKVSNLNIRKWISSKSIQLFQNKPALC